MQGTMAADVPDAQNLQSWQEAFQYPIPTVRRVEQELRRDISSNREKLRSLVGVRYRDLLGTAQTIMEMNGKIQTVESCLADIGRRCNPRAIEQKPETDRDASESEQKSIAAQLALLHNCRMTISRLLRKRGSNLLVAKLLVISRLLLKTLWQTKHAPAFLDNLRNQLASLGRSLLSRINRRLSSIHTSVEGIVESMCACCLATSYSSGDVIRHFHRIREEAISNMLQRTDPSHGSILQALKLYLRTLQDTASLLSSYFPNALRKLTAHPILDDPEVQGLDNLGIDIYKRWVASDIRNFTPWVKHSEFSKSDAEKLIKEWAKDAFGKLTTGMSKAIADCHDFGDILSLRKNIHDIWLPIQSSTPTHSPLEVLDGLRQVANDQLVTILRAQGKSLTHIGLDISSVITNWAEVQENVTAPSLWDTDLVYLNLSEGAEAFKKEVTNRALGRDDNVLQIFSTYHAWLASVGEYRAMIRELETIRWEDVVEEDEDEDVMQNTIGLLHEDDPALLQKEHKETLAKGFNALQTSLHGALANMSGDHRGQQAAFLLRIIREVRNDLPAELSTDDYLFAHDLVPRLHQILAAEVISQASVPNLTKYMEMRKPRCPGRSLWEGEPPLPAQPSPVAFSLLRQVVANMEEQGPDLWNADAVDVLKNDLSKGIASTTLSTVQNGLFSTLSSSTKSASGTDLSGDEERDAEREDVAVDPIPESVIEDHKVQLLFDILYMGKALSLRKPSDTKQRAFDEVTELVLKDLNLDGTSKEELERRAKKYWDQTKLLFGLLG